jgi:SAM-dependent methyltransferase
MTRQNEISANERFDFYSGHYSRFDSELAAEVRREVYGEDFGQTGWRTAAEQADIVDHLRLGPGSRVLDIACGAGGPSLALVERTQCEVTGVDIEPAAIAHANADAHARGLADRSTFEVVDCSHRLAYKDGAFDTVLCIDAISHEAGSVEIRDAFPDHRQSCAISRRLPLWQPAAGVRRVAVAARLFRKQEGPARDISMREQTRFRPIFRRLAARHERSLADRGPGRAQDGGSR